MAWLGDEVRAASDGDDMERSGDWMGQAQRDLAAARHQRTGGFHEWAAFVAQQSAEKAIKAVYQRLGGDAWGHSCHQLLAGLRDAKGIDTGDVESGARLLDRFYVPARYPNGWQAGIPGDMYREKDADDAIGAAAEILRFCQNILAGS